MPVRVCDCACNSSAAAALSSAWAAMDCVTCYICATAQPRTSSGGDLSGDQERVSENDWVERNASLIEATADTGGL
jgi:hypothetical protein